MGAPQVVAPLHEIEREVKEQAKDLALDLADATGERGLRRLIHQQIGEWNEQHKRGVRPFELTDVDRLEERAFRNLTGYGPLTELLDDDDVWEIMVNAPDAIFVKRHTGPSGYHDEAFHDDEHVVRTLTKLLDDSSTSHRKLDPSEGLQDAQLDNGARLHIVHQDIARGGHLVVNIRKFTGVTFTNLAQLVERSMVSAQVATFLASCVQSGASVVFSGAPGSGKTTMLSCCAAEIDAAKRVVVAEEVFEADVPVATAR